MKMSARDKWLLAILPAILTAILYVFGKGWISEKALKDARLQSEKARAAMLQPAVLAGKMKVLGELNDKLSDQRDLAAKLGESAKSVQLKPSGNRTETLKKISEMLNAKNLSLLNSARLAEGALKDSKHSALAEQIGLPVPELWRMEIAGSYRNMLEAIDAMGASDSFIVPLSIGMEPLNEDAGTQRWSLTLWI